MRKKLDNIRKKIDTTDRQILSLLNKRASLAQQTSQYKRTSFYDPKREKEVLNKIFKKNNGPLSEKDIQNIYLEILSSCREIQAPTNISYLGPPGSHIHEAAQKKFGERSNKIESKTIKEGNGSLNEELIVFNCYLVAWVSCLLITPVRPLTNNFIVLFVFICITYMKVTSRRTPEIFFYK